MKDREVKKLVRREEKRQRGTVNLIASESAISADVSEALGSVFTNKYAEGYPGARYYAGTENADGIERLATSRALKLFKLSPERWAVNVQPYSGTPANLAVLLALVPRGKKVMAMSLAHGGHLSHGHAASATGMLWKQVPYGVDPKSERLDYAALKRLAAREKPRALIAGYTAYSRSIDWKRLRAAADGARAILIADLSHTAGLVAGGALPSPFPYADVVVMTMHKTLRGPRAALVFSRLRLARKIDRAVFPGLQGGPHLATIAGVAVALREASLPAFRRYARETVRNARALAGALEELGWRIVSGGTDSHLFLLDTMKSGITGAEASDALERAGIIVNKNMLPFDSRRPQDPSGIRIGTAAATARGMKEPDMRRLARRIHETLTRKL